MRKLIAKFRNAENGATAIEYGLIAALIAVVLIVALQTVGGNASNTFSEIGSALS
jgi:pilus assembly protein Flp/PilA